MGGQAYLNEHKSWTSFNRPFFEEIFNVSNQSAMVQLYGDHYSWVLRSPVSTIRTRTLNLNPTPYTIVVTIVSTGERGSRRPATN
jgi:hypothetical protein